MILHRRYFHLIAIAFLLIGQFFAQPVFAAGFSDVSSKYEEAVDFLSEKGIQGTADGLFGIDESITRVDAAVFVAKALDLNLEAAPPSTFTDVPKRAVNAVNALKAKEITKGKTRMTFGAHDRITRGELAMWLTKAYALEGGHGALPFTDVAPRYTVAVQALVHHQITNGTSKTHFGTNDLAKRGDFALFLYRAKLVKTNDEKLKIERVEAITGNQIEVDFNRPVKKGEATLIEKAGNRIVAYDQSQYATTAGFVSEIISFSHDRKSATVILKSRTNREQTLTEGKHYTVALVSDYGDHLGFAQIESASGWVVLLKGLSLPEIEIDESQNYIVMKYDRKMNDEAINPENYDLYDTGVIVKNALGEGEWEDTTTRNMVKFNIQPNILLADKTYKVKINAAVKTEGDTALPPGESVAILKTPTAEEAKPKVEMIRVTAPNQVMATFDRTLSTINSINLYLFSIKEKNGKSIGIQEIQFQDEHLILTTKEDYVFDEHLEYTVSLPSGVAINDKFQNAANDELYHFDAVVARNKAPTTMKAQFIRQQKNKKKANLHLTFDHAVVLENINREDIQIERFGEAYFIEEKAAIEVDRNDQTGRTLIIKDVSNAFSKNQLHDQSKFTPKKSDVYQVIVKKNVAKSIAPVPLEEKQSNQADLKVIVDGIDVLAPQIDRVTLHSAEKITIQFDKNIIASELSAAHIQVAGFVKAVGARYEPAILTGEASLVFSVDKNKLIIKPASDTVKFQTGMLEERETIVTIGPDTIKDQNGLENEGMTYAANVTEPNVYDDARPIMIGATVRDTTTGKVEVMYSEAVYGKTNNRTEIANQFNVSGAEKNAYATDTTIGSTVEEATHIVEIQFTNNVFKQKDYSLAKLIYTHNLNYTIRDDRQNEQESAFMKGIYVPAILE